ncbi:MAG: ATP-binding cassette domain-containing protein [candidate division Zixibacteria bacterium]|jgi:lipooligosaccharide transport system ATP-binding protein|nr:ATP-binding cassette domain-containing protein [candidate division Zixibacteria bacterium]
MPDIIISARKLFKRYKDLVAVDHIDFDIMEGETFGFLGPNGAGKTTTMKMLYCFILPDGGKLTVDNLDVVKDSRKVKAILGVVHQEDSLDPDLSVKENLVTYARYFDIPKKISGPRADSLIEMMSLTEKKDTIIDELSGGLKRRLMIIRGLINNPRILILDEPTTGLDPQARHLVWQKLRTLKKSGITIILTTHYMEEAAQLCDRLVMMHKSRIIASGAPDRLIAEYASREVVEIRDPDDRLINDSQRLLNDGDSLEKTDDTIYIFTQNASSILGRLRGYHFSGVTERRANLEDVFLKLAGRGLID